MPIKATTKKGIIAEEMHRFKGGELHSGKGGPVVRNKSQAIAIALSMGKRHGK